MSEIGKCPLCERENVDQNIEFASGVCTDCGFVISDREQSVEPGQTEVVDISESSTASVLSEEWTQVVEVQDRSEQNLVDLLSMTETLGETLLVSSDGRIRAAEVVTEAWRRDILHGRSMSAGAGAAVHIACRESGYPRPVRRIADAVELDVSTLHKTYRPLVDVLELDLDSPQPIEFVPFICDSLKRSATESAMAQDMLRDRNEDMTGNPAGIAAAAVYITLQDNTPKDRVTYREVATVVSMTKETVWKRATELRQASSVG